MGVWEGLLGGFTARKYDVEAQNLKESQLASAREQAVFESLLASDNPEVRDLAVAGLLDSAQPRKKAGGLRGWIGETVSSPFLSQIQALRQPTTETKTTLPAKTLQPMIPQTPGEEPSALPATTPVTGGPPPTPTYQQTGGTPYSVTTPPKPFFLSPEEKYRQQAKAKASGDVEGEVAGLIASGIPVKDAQELVKQGYLRRTAGTAGQTYREGNIIPDPASPTGYSQELYLAANPSQKMTIPAQPPLTAAQREINAAATARGRTDVMAGAPLSTQQRFQATSNLRDEWMKAEAPLREMQRQHQLMETGLQRFRAGDKIGGSQAVLVTFQKILDPQSVVRETEYARSPGGLSLVSRMEGYIQRLAEGGAGVPDTELAEMTETARQFLAGMEGWNANLRTILEQEARGYAIDPQRLFGPGQAAITPPPAAGAPPTPQANTAPSGAQWYQDANGNWILRAPQTPTATPPPAPMRPLPSH